MVHAGRILGFEPKASAWETDVVPLRDVPRRLPKCAKVRGFSFVQSYQHAIATNVGLSDCAVKLVTPSAGSPLGEREREIVRGKGRC